MKHHVVVIVVAASLVLGTLGLVYSLAYLVPDQSVESTGEQGVPDDLLITGADAGALNYDQLVEQVAPVGGTTLAVNWDDMGQKLIESGAIDQAKFESLYNGLSEEQQAILLGDSLTEITFTHENIVFWTNVLWALGLVQESTVLSEGPMMQNMDRTPLENYASTGGWTLGSYPATELYNSARLIDLTPEQDILVARVAANVFRPCCNNPTAYPDCNHGMAVLGLLELLASQGATQDELYAAALVFNGYAFVDSYARVAAYFSLQGISWPDVSPRVILAPAYSSAEGAQRVAAAVGPIPGMTSWGGSCGA